MKSIQKAFAGVATSLSLAAVAVLGRPYLMHALTSLRYYRMLQALEAQYQAELRDVDRRVNQIGTAFFESRRDYFTPKTSELNLGPLMMEAVLESGLQSVKRVVAMELWVRATRRYMINLLGVGAKDKALQVQYELRDQEFDNTAVYDERMRPSGFPIDDLLAYLKRAVTKDG